MACEVPFFSRERVLQLPGRRWLNGIAPPLEEFVIKENVNFEKQDKQASEGVAHTDNNTVPTNNLPPLPKLIWMPSVCAQQFTSFEQSSSKIGPKSTHWAQFRTKSHACT